MKKYLLIVAFASAIASPALAAPHSQAYRGGDDGAYAAVPDGDDIPYGNEIVGRDPDANVRLQLLRDANSKDF